MSSRNFDKIRDMADHTAPLLPLVATASTGATSASSRHSSKSSLHSIDDVIETYIGSTSAAAQLLPASLVVLAWIFDAQQTFISVFADAMPPWNCTAPSCSSAAASGSPCGLPPSSWSWSLPRHTSTVSSWSLECASPALLALPSSSFFAGCLVGGFLFATLADSYLGRKNTLVLSLLVMSLSAALTAASPSLLVYSALRFISGLGRSTIGTSVLVLSTELVSRRWRDRVSIIGFFCFTMGFLSLPAIAYTMRGASWRTLYLLTAAPALVYCVVIYFMARESPRWLLVAGRKSEAIETIKWMTLETGDAGIWSSFSNLSLLDFGGEEDSSENIFSSVKKLWQKKWALRRLSAVMTVGLGVGIVYYGMPLNLGNLSSNLYLSVTLNALIELPASLLVFFVIGQMNRRSSTLVFTAASGVFSLSCAAIGAGSGGWTVVGAELAAFFAACTAFSFLLIYSIELFPTCVRNSAIAMVRQALVLGGVVAPVLVAAGRRRRLLSFGLFGLAIGCCGLFAACLPETRGRKLSDTMEEEEKKEAGGKRTVVASGAIP